MNYEVINLDQLAPAAPPPVNPTTDTRTAEERVLEDSSRDYIAYGIAERIKLVRGHSVHYTNAFEMTDEPLPPSVFFITRDHDAARQFVKKLVGPDSLTWEAGQDTLYTATKAEVMGPLAEQFPKAIQVIESLGCKYPLMCIGWGGITLVGVGRCGAMVHTTTHLVCRLDGTVEEIHDPHRAIVMIADLADEIRTTVPGLSGRKAAKHLRKAIDLIRDRCQSAAATDHGDLDFDDDGDDD